jgi:hypothetical protein
MHTNRTHSFPPEIKNQRILLRDKTANLEQARNKIEMKYSLVEIIETLFLFEKTKMT